MRIRVTYDDGETFDTDLDDMVRVDDGIREDEASLRSSLMETGLAVIGGGAAPAVLLKRIEGGV